MREPPFEGPGSRHRRCSSDCETRRLWRTTCTPPLQTCAESNSSQSAFPAEKRATISVFCTQNKFPVDVHETRPNSKASDAMQLFSCRKICPSVSWNQSCWCRHGTSPKGGTFNGFSLFRVPSGMEGEKGDYCSILATWTCTCCFGASFPTHLWTTVSQTSSFNRSLDKSIHKLYSL